MVINGAKTVHPGMIDGIVDGVKKLLDVDVYPIGSTANPRGPSKDIDVLVDGGSVSSKYGFKNPREAIVHICRVNDLETVTQGVSVHVKYPHGAGFVQVDIMVADNARVIQFFHVHDIPQWSPYKGRHRHILMNHLAKRKSLKWSPYRGLVDRETGEFITRDPDEVARILVGEHTDRNNITSADQIITSLANGDEVLKELISDPAWN